MRETAPGNAVCPLHNPSPSPMVILPAVLCAGVANGSVWRRWYRRHRGSDTRAGPAMAAPAARTVAQQPTLARPWRRLCFAKVCRHPGSSRPGSRGGAAIGSGWHAAGGCRRHEPGAWPAGHLAASTFSISSRGSSTGSSGCTHTGRWHADGEGRCWCCIAAAGVAFSPIMQ